MKTPYDPALTMDGLPGQRGVVSGRPYSGTVTDLYWTVRDTPIGPLVGYQDLADRVGEPGAARAVGVAMSSNPLPVIVPCHRVIESGGGIGGFGGGLEIKRKLL